MFTEMGMHFLEVYNQLNQLQTSNILKTATSTELQTIGPTQPSNQHLATHNNRWKCEKCLIPFAIRNSLKLHKWKTILTSPYEVNACNHQIRYAVK